jgi:hypothetical protein
MPEILEEEIRRIPVPNQLNKQFIRLLSPKNPLQKGMVEWLKV